MCSIVLTSAHNTVFVFEHQSASLNNGLYTMMLTILFCLANLLMTAKSIAVVSVEKRRGQTRRARARSVEGNLTEGPRYISN